jgi:hypothetical protein
MGGPTYDDISEMIPSAQRPWLDREGVDERSLDAAELEWWRDGVVHLPGLMPDHLIDGYVRLRERFPRLPGWSCPVPYMYYRELRDICLYPPLMETMQKLIGFEMGLHLNLTGWVSTERALHCDDYLNPEFVNSHYCAAWIALDDIVPESGPFQYVRDSHKWPTIRQHKLFRYLTPEQQKAPSWPSDTQEWVEQACLAETEKRGAKFEVYLPKRGDVLLWHGCLLHRGSVPAVRGTIRKALIAHYSSIHHRPDMPSKRKWKGQWYFVHEQAIDEGSPAQTVARSERVISKLRATANRLSKIVRMSSAARRM